MRNLKRALSLALASVMLLGMMVVGTSAASVNDFTDVDEIVNSEAAAITSGLGLFSGYEDNTFRPTEEVNRGIMAAIIGKMVNGTKLNFDIFKGNSPFTDTVTYQGGWAEGYANWCYSTGIANGYGNGIYGVADTVTTWQAALMLQRALGYWDKNDTSSVTGPAAINELSVMAKASELGMLGDLELKANQPLTRDDLSVMVYETLWAQMAKYDSGRGVYVKYYDQDVTVGKSTDDPYNTLAYSTFGLEIAEGVVIRNSAVDPALAATDNSEAMTTVVLEDGEAYDFEYETGLDLIGHAVNVYYAVDKKDVVVYAITDQAVVTGMITYDKDSYTAMNAAAVAAGFKSKSLPTGDYALNYDLFATADVQDGDYMLLISNSANKAVDCVIVLQQKLDTILVDTNAKDELVYTTANGYLDVNVMDEVADGDYVIVTETCYDENGNATYAIVEKADLINAKITKITGKTAANSFKIVYTGATKYYQSPVAYTDGLDTSLLTGYQSISKLQDETLVLDTFGNLIAVTKAPSAPAAKNYAYVAQFGYKYGTINDLTDEIVLSAHVYYADGTNKIEIVNIDASWDEIEKALKVTDEVDIEAKYASLNADKFIGLYKVTKKDGLVKLERIGEDVVNDLNKDGNTVTKGHSTITNNKVSVKVDNEVVYQNSETVYFYVTGTYGKSGFKVQPYIGVAKAPTFTVDSTTKYAIQEGYLDASGEKVLVDAMLVKTGTLPTAEVAPDVLGDYYYNKGNYHIDTNEAGKVVLTFEVYTEYGVYGEVSYVDLKNYNTVAKAKAAAKDMESGYYTFKTNGWTKIVDVTDNDEKSTNHGEDDNYVWFAAGVLATGATVEAGTSVLVDNYEYNLFTTVTDEGFIFTNAKVVDLTGHGVNTFKRLYKAVTDETLELTVSYSYDGDTYESAVIYVVGYEDLDTGDQVVQPEEPEVAGLTALFLDGSNGDVGMKLGVPTAADAEYTITLEYFAPSTGEWKTYNTYTATVAANTNAGYMGYVWADSNFTMPGNASYRVTCGDVISNVVVK